MSNVVSIEELGTEDVGAPRATSIGGTSRHARTLGYRLHRCIRLEVKQ